MRRESAGYPTAHGGPGDTNLFPAPGGPFTLAEWEDTTHGPRLLSAPTWAMVEVESFTTVGWSDLATTRIVNLTIGEDEAPLEHRRGRYRRVE